MPMALLAALATFNAASLPQKLFQAARGAKGELSAPGNFAFVPDGGAGRSRHRPLRRKETISQGSLQHRFFHPIPLSRAPVLLYVPPRCHKIAPQLGFRGGGWRLHVLKREYPCLQIVQVDRRVPALGLGGRAENDVSIPVIIVGGIGIDLTRRNRNLSLCTVAAVRIPPSPRVRVWLPADTCQE